MTFNLRHLISSIFVIIAVLVSSIVEAKPVKVLDGKPTETVSIDAISHDVFDALLLQYVDTSGNVDYTRWQKEDFKTLENYLKNLGTANPKLEATESNTLAYWINAYNALTIYGILEKYPTSSIRNHTAKLFGYNIWKDLKLRIAERVYSLDDIEHDILRKMGEPRIHFAIVCASESCPRLLNEAYTGEKLENQLVTNAAHFFAQDGNFQINPDAARIQLSSILKWFGKDFGANQSDILETISPYLPDPKLVGSRKRWKVSYLPYSWKLNDQKDN